MIKQIIHSTLFFLKTTLFSIYVNPLLLTLIPFTLLFAATKELDKSGVIFCMLLFSLTGILLKPLSLNGGIEDGNGVNLTLFYKLLPLEKQVIHISLFLTILIYSLLLYIPFAVILTRSLSLPPLDDLSIIYNNESHLSYLSGTYYTPRGLLQYFNENQYPSLLFGMLKDRSGWQLFPGALLLLPLLGCTSTIYVLLLKIFKPNIRKHVILTAVLTIISLFILVSFFIGDLFLSSWAVGEIRTMIDKLNGEVYLSLLLSLTIFFLITTTISILKSTIMEESHV